MTDKKYSISLNSRLWNALDEDGAARRFVKAGFRTADEVLELRVYDFLNIRHINRLMAEDMLHALYRVFNENKEIDDALYNFEIDQYYDKRAWHRRHPDPAKVKVKDLVLEDDMNIDALIDLFDYMCHKFWKSDEYDWKEYRYWDYAHILETQEEEAKQEAKDHE